MPEVSRRVVSVRYDTKKQSCLYTIKDSNGDIVAEGIEEKGLSFVRGLPNFLSERY